jgi:hypothetical protein
MGTTPMNELGRSTDGYMYPSFHTHMYVIELSGLSTNGDPSIVLNFWLVVPNAHGSLCVGAPSLLSPLDPKPSNSHVCRSRLCCAVAHLLLSSFPPCLPPFSNHGLHAIRTLEYPGFRRSIIPRQHGTLSAYGTASLLQRDLSAGLAVDCFASWVRSQWIKV